MSGEWWTWARWGGCIAFWGSGGNTMILNAVACMVEIGRDL